MTKKRSQAERKAAAVQRNTPIKICFEVLPATAPALRSLIEEKSNRAGEKLEGVAAFAREQAWTNASIAVASLRAAINKAVPHGDPNYG